MISKAIAKTNKKLFEEKLINMFKERDMEAEFKEIIICSKNGDQPLNDEYGRYTFFKIRLSKEEVPIY